MPPIVMIVDDHEGFRRELIDYLRLMLPSARTIEAASGSEAVIMAESERPDMVLMDIRMPGMNGIEATRRIKAALPSTKVAILTMLDDTYSRQMADAAGADVYLVKGEGRILETTLLKMLSRCEGQLVSNLPATHGKTLS